MDRRQFLALSTVGFAGLAGCTSGDGGSQPTNNPTTTTSTPTETPTTTEPTTTETPTPTPTGPVQHKMGTSFTVGSGAQSIRYILYEAYEISDYIGSEYLKSEPDGTFLVAILRLENVGKETLDISTRPFVLVDTEGNLYEPDSEAMVYVTNDERINHEPIQYEQLQPGLEISRSLVFDIPAGRTYGLLVRPAGVFSNAKSHLAPIGTVKE